MTVDIAIIDSGINPAHPHVHGVAGGLSFKLDGNHKAVKDADFSDNIGHGTAIAGVIRKSVPHSTLYAVKIFQKDLRASGSLLIEGLEWAVCRQIKIIHLSLGTKSEQYKADLKELCQKAYSKNLIVLAAGRTPDDSVFPASFQGCYRCLPAKRDCEPGMMTYHPGSDIEFGACGWPRTLPGLPREMNFQGHSFAVAHVTAHVAKLVGQKSRCRTDVDKKEIN